MITDGPRASWPDRPASTLAEVALVLGGSGDSFTGQLLALMMKADPLNRARLARAFPRESRVLDLWYNEMSANIPTIAELAAAVEQRGI